MRITAKSTLEHVAAVLSVALRGAGRFARNGAYYEHPRNSFFVEFPRGPLAIGTDTSITPVEIQVEGVPLLLLSATDSCRDRLAAFYHWRDRQALGAAVAIADSRPPRSRMPEEPPD